MAKNIGGKPNKLRDRLSPVGKEAAAGALLVTLATSLSVFAAGGLLFGHALSRLPKAVTNKNKK